MPSDTNMPAVGAKVNRRRDIERYREDRRSGGTGARPRLYEVVSPTSAPMPMSVRHAYIAAPGQVPFAMPVADLIPEDNWEPDAGENSPGIRDNS